MPFGLTHSEFAELVLLTAGGVVILVGATILGTGGRWRDLLRLPDPPEHNVEAIDVLVGVLVFLAMSSVFLPLFGLWLGEPATSQPTSAPQAEALPSAIAIASHAAGQAATAAILLYIGMVRFRRRLSGWGIRTDRLGRDIVLALGVYVPVWAACGVLLYVTRIAAQFAIRLVEPGYEMPDHTAIQTLQAEGVADWIRAVTIISALVLAPIVEELLFRGLLQPALTRWWRSQWLAILVSGCAFGLLHYPVFYTVPPLAFFGVVLGYLYARTRSLTLVILLHAVFNGKTILWIVLGG